MHIPMHRIPAYDVFQSNFTKFTCLPHQLPNFDLSPVQYQTQRYVAHRESVYGKLAGGSTQAPEKHELPFHPGLPWKGTAHHD
jgi:hypothetical protein